MDEVELGEELRRWLLSRGASPDQIGPTIRVRSLTGLSADLVLTEGVTFSAREVADRVGLDVSAVVDLFRQFGVSVPDPDALQFTERDVTLVSAFHRAGLHGRTDAALARVMGAALDRMADAAVAFYVQGPDEAMTRAGTDPLEQARRSAEATQQALDLGTALGVLFRHHMLQTIARLRVVQSGVARRELVRVAIGFVDLVGSTGIQAGLEPGDLAAMVSAFEARAFDLIAAAGGRLVKFIGDEIMVAATDAVAGCRIVEALVEAFTEDGLQPRGGLVYGEVLFRNGDYYGPVVNLAARLVSEAIPGEVLVDRSVVESAGDGMAFAPAGRRLLKGFDTPTQVWSLSGPEP